MASANILGNWQGLSPDTDFMGNLLRGQEYQKQRLGNRQQRELMPFVRPMAEQGLRKSILENMMSQLLYQQEPERFGVAQGLAKAQTGLTGAQTGLAGAQTGLTGMEAKKIQFLMDNPILMTHDPVSAALVYSMYGMGGGQQPQGVSPILGGSQAENNLALPKIPPRENILGKISQTPEEEQQTFKDFLETVNGSRQNFRAELSSMSDNDGGVYEARVKAGLEAPNVPSITGNQLADNLLYNAGAADPIQRQEALTNIDLAKQDKQKYLEMLSGLLPQAASAELALKNNEDFMKYYNEAESGFGGGAIGPLAGNLAGIIGGPAQSAKTASENLVLNMGNVLGGGSLTNEGLSRVEASKPNIFMEREAAEDAYRGTKSQLLKKIAEISFFAKASEKGVPLQQAGAQWVKFLEENPISGYDELDKEMFETIDNYINPNYTKKKPKSNVMVKARGSKPTDEVRWE